MLPDYEIKRAPRIREHIDAIIFFVWMLLLIQFCLFTFIQPDQSAEGMRFRIIANSNTMEDQQVKRIVKESISPILLQYKENPENTYKQLEQAVDKLAVKLNEDIVISTGHAIFPPKVWNEGIIAQENVQSIVITIGSGRGDNWWCALFPKACYKEEQKEKPKFWVWEWLKEKFLA